MKNILAFVFSLFLINIAAVAQSQSDTILVKNDTLFVQSDTLLQVNDTLPAMQGDTLVQLNDTVPVVQGDTLQQTIDTQATDTAYVLLAVPVNAVPDSTIRGFFEARLDSLVALYDTLKVDMSNIDGEERTNPTFVRMFMRPTLYRSVLGKDYLNNIDLGGADDSQMAIDAKRSQVIDGLLLGLYKNNPSYVWATEDEIRKEVTVDKVDKSQTAGITLAPIQPIIIPDNVQGELATKIVKPNYWRTYGAFGANYTQNFFSDNWRSGGENTKNMLLNIEFKLNYDDKKKIKFENHLEAKLGFYTAPSDTVHTVKTNQDLLRFTTKLGYKGWKNMYYSVQAQV